MAREFKQLVDPLRGLIKPRDPFAPPRPKRAPCVACKADAHAECRRECELGARGVYCCCGFKVA